MSARLIHPLLAVIRVFVLTIFVNVAGVEMVQGQDAQFSQYYAAPLYLNPALCGINQQGRAGLNYRDQWPSIAASYETYSFYMDYYFDEKYSALGLIVNTDQEGVAGLRSTDIGLQYAYQLRLNYNWTFRPGVEVSYYWRNINFDKLTFGDQFDASGQVSSVTSESFDTGMNKGFADLSLGGIVYNEKAWFGVAMHHVTEPNQAIAGGTDPLRRKFSIHGGYKIYFSEMNPRSRRSPHDRERSMTPTINYKQQGSFKQLDVGLNFTLDPMMLGIWYRGLPINGFNDTKNSEAIVSMIGFNVKKLTIGYSFDYTISDLGMATGGAHEISLTYVFSLADPRKPPRDVRELRCPVPFIF